MSQEDKNKKTQKIKTAAKEWVESIVIAFVLAMFIRTFFIQAFKIPSGSMKTTLLIGDRLMVNKVRYGPLIPFTSNRINGYSEPESGDIIVFKFPEDPKRDFIKRLIAKGGEKVEIRNGDIYINDKLVRDPVIKDNFYYNKSPFGEAGQPVVVPEGYFYVLGDNSLSSHDSRYWGWVPEHYVIGKAEFIYWPFNRIRVLK